jgi:hypothetical protein
MRWLNSSIVIYALLCIVLGIYGAVSAGEYFSLAGVLIGLLELGCLAALPKNPRLSRIGSLVIALGVLGMFLPKFIKLGKWLPAGVLTFASAILVVALIAGHLLGMQPKNSTIRSEG